MVLCGCDFILLMILFINWWNLVTFISLTSNGFLLNLGAIGLTLESVHSEELNVLIKISVLYNTPTSLWLIARNAKEVKFVFCEILASLNNLVGRLKLQIKKTHLITKVRNMFAELVTNTSLHLVQKRVMRFHFFLNILHATVEHCNLLLQVSKLALIQPVRITFPL